MDILSLLWGKLYGPEYVHRLRQGVARHLKRAQRCVCFTSDATGLDPEVEVFPIFDVDLPEQVAFTPWRKLGLFRDDLPVRGQSLFPDLDLVIIGPMDRFFDYEPDMIPIIHNWVEEYKIFKRRPEIGNSSGFRFEAGKRGFVVEKHFSEKEWTVKPFWPPQTYLTECVGRK